MTKLDMVAVLILLSAMPFSVISQFIPAERTALLNLKLHWSNPPVLQHWNATSSPCDWSEIRCSTDGSVTELNLSNYNIIGSIPTSFSTLSNLTVLDLGFNLFEGDFPSAVLNCSKLRYLDLSQNLFVGNIPAEIDRIGGIQYLDIGANNFTGDIPPSIGNLTQLRTLLLNSNLFNGSYPVEISNLVNLQSLGLSYNAFSAAVIPSEFGRLEKIKSIWMTNANVIGRIPDSFGNLKSLEHLDLSINDMDGEIPPGLLLLKNLSHVYLYKNRFSGSIPQVIESFNIVDLDLSMNTLNGSIPLDFGKLANLQFLKLYKNNLSGEIPSTIGLLPNLRNFSVFTNKLSGNLPPDMGIHSRLEIFEVSDNYFTGNLPENLCSGGTLFGVVAYNNDLSGEIPKALGNCQSLYSVQLYGNRFSGEIPLGLWTVPDMSSLRLSDNSFSGQLPSRLSSNLTRLEISNNEFSGGIPVEVSSWESLIVFKASNNMFSGRLPLGLTGLNQITTLLLDGNSLSGDLPSRVISWESLITLNLARNRLSGRIPLSIASLPRLLDLDLSQNEFYGDIPSQLGRLELTSLNLSSNKLTGRIPYPFDNMAYGNSFLNNPSLCGVILSVGGCHPKSRGKDMSPGVLAVVIILAVALLIVLIFSIQFFIREYKRKKLNCRVATWKLTSFQRVDFTEVNILSSLVESNVIGSGSSGKVYRIPVERAGQYVAVKRIYSDRKMEKAFLAEIQILSSVYHSNIVKLLCCISSEDSKLLVYEYMENESLDKWLHGRKKKNAAGDIALKWPTRLRIAIGAAQGLCYMHHDCTPPVIHRDVKSSNILLDSSFKPKVADFGLAKLLIKDGNSMSAIAGSFGYIAPEYAYTTKVDEKSDIYSFGVVLLELVTGREPNHGDGHTNLAEWAWKSTINVFDEEVKEARYEEEMMMVLKLGIMCTSPLPASRPSMKEVLQILQQCRSFKGKMVGREYDAAPLLGNDKYISSYRFHSKKLVVDDSESSLVRIV